MRLNMCQNCDINDDPNGKRGGGSCYRPKETPVTIVEQLEEQCENYGQLRCQDCKLHEIPEGELVGCDFYSAGPGCEEPEPDKAPEETGDELGDLDGIVDGGFDGIAQAVRKLAAAAERIEGSGLNRRAIVLLLADASGLGKQEVERLLNSLRGLKERFLSGE